MTIAPPPESLQNDYANLDLLAGVLASPLLGITVYDAVLDPDSQVIDFRIRQINETGLRMAGNPANWEPGRTLAELYPDRAIRTAFADLVQVYETGLARESEEYYPQFSRWYALTVMPIRNGLMLTYQDISVRKKAEAEQQRQTNLLETVMNAAQTSISLHRAIRNEAGQIVDFETVLANQRARQFWGDMAHDILTKPYQSLQFGFDTTDEFARYVRVVETGQAETFEYTFANRYYTNAVTKADDGVVISAADITDIRNAKAQVEAANRELQRSNDNLQSFAYIASHDLQEPLRKIESFGDLLNTQFGSVLGEAGQDYIVRMQSASQRMSLLIKDLLSYSRIGTQPDTRLPVSLATVFAEIREDLETVIRESEAEIAMGPLPTVPGEGLLLRQLFQNLLSNAIKFRRAGVRPQIRVESRVVAPAELPTELAHSDQTFHEICIADNGLGFDPKHTEQIFEVFQRLHGKQKFAGSGVGLAIVKKVAGQHGGCVTATGKPGQGATFRVYLPV
jgi:signal transduction histidine kinase